MTTREQRIFELEERLEAIRLYGSSNYGEAERVSMMIEELEREEEARYTLTGYNNESGIITLIEEPMEYTLAKAKAEALLREDGEDNLFKADTVSITDIKTNKVIERLYNSEELERQYREALAKVLGKYIQAVTYTDRLAVTSEVMKGLKYGVVDASIWLYPENVKRIREAVKIFSR